MKGNPLYIIAAVLSFLFLIFMYIRINGSNEGYANQNLVIVTSVIHTNNKPLAYTDTRSVFSIQDRVAQTINTIETARSKIPNAYIVLVEGSTLTGDEEAMLKSVVDRIHYVSDDTKKYINGSFKGLGETSQLLDFFTHCEASQAGYQTITKISGRYFLDDMYDFNAMPIEKFCIARDNARMEWKFTSSYRVPGLYTPLYKNEIIRVFDAYIEYTKDNTGELSLEAIMFNDIDDSKINYMKRYGVSGYIAVNGELIESFRQV